jgi:hypothetical protein
VTSWFIFDTLSGRTLQEFTPQSGTWSERGNEAEQISVTIPLSDPDLAGMDWRNLATEWKSSIAVEEHGRFYGGPILPHDWANNKLELNLTARGIWTYFDHRHVLPSSAATQSLVLSSGMPNTALDTNLSGLDLGTIVKRLVQRACAWSGAALPIIYMPDRAGTRGKTYAALDFKKVGSAITDITNLVGGPDVRFRLVRDGLYFSWMLETGTENEPRLQSPSIFDWDFGAEDLAADELTVKTDPSYMADIAWATGGRNADVSLVSRASTTKLRAAGYPLLETLDSSHSDVVEQETLNSYTAETLRTAYVPANFWAIKVKADASPYLYEYAVGDLARVHVEGSPYLPDGTYPRRIAALSGDEQGEWITVTFGEVYDG